MTLQNLAQGATSVIAVFAILGWFLNMRQNRQNLELSRKSLAVQALLPFIETMEKLRDKRHRLEKAISDDPQFDILKDPDNMLWENGLDELARGYDKLGLLVKHGLVPVHVVMDFYSRPLVIGWRYLGPMVLQVRDDRKQMGHMLKFEVIAVGARKYRLEYSLSREDELFKPNDNAIKEWEKWKAHWPSI